MIPTRDAINEDKDEDNRVGNKENKDNRKNKKEQRKRKDEKNQNWKYQKIMIFFKYLFI